jgi:hypothetical protein
MVLSIFEVVEPRELVKLGFGPPCLEDERQLFTLGGGSAGFVSVREG